MVVLMIKYRTNNGETQTNFSSFIDTIDSLIMGKNLKVLVENGHIIKKYLR